MLPPRYFACCANIGLDSDAAQRTNKFPNWLKANIGYAWLPVELANEGQTVGVASEWGDRQARVVPMPFIDPGKQIPKQ